jgi:chromosome segregation ATPase
MDPRRLFYKTATIIALLAAGLVGKKCYDASVVRKAELQKQIQVDSAFIRDQNKVIGELNGRVAQADAAADSARALAAQAKVVTRKVRADYDSLRADLDTTNVDDLNAALDSADAVIAAQDDQIAEQESAIDALVRARAVAADREKAKDEKIAALDRLNRDITKSLPTQGSSLLVHLRDAAIGGAVVWVATR